MSVIQFPKPKSSGRYAVVIMSNCGRTLIDMRVIGKDKEKFMAQAYDWLCIEKNMNALWLLGGFADKVKIDIWQFGTKQKAAQFMEAMREDAGEGLIGRAPKQEQCILPGIQLGEAIC